MLIVLMTLRLTSRCEALPEAAGIATRPAIGISEMLFQHFAIEPMDQTAVIGSKVTLPCRVVNQRGPIQWTKDDFGLGAVRNLTGYDRYSMIGSDEEGKDFYFSNLHSLINYKLIFLMVVKNLN